jgi:hypothetical protein
MEDEIIWIKIMGLRVGKASWTPIVPRGHAIRVNFVDGETGDHDDYEPTFGTSGYSLRMSTRLAIYLHR